VDLNALAYWYYGDRTAVGLNGLLERAVCLHFSLGFPVISRFNFLVENLCVQCSKSLLKLKSIQISDWARHPLRPAQRHYAASDAVVGIKSSHRNFLTKQFLTKLCCAGWSADFRGRACTVR
jgi:hypothetical protein